MAGENEGGSATLETPATGSTETAAPEAPASESADQITWAQEPAADAGDAGDTNDAAPADPHAAMVSAVESALNAKDEATPATPTQAKGQAQEPAADADAGPAPSLSAELAQSLAAEFGETGTKLAGEMNKLLADMHTKIGAVKPVADQVQSVAQRQAQEDAQRESARVHSVFDKMAEKYPVYGKGENANPYARDATHAAALKIARDIASSPAKRAAFEKSTKGMDPYEAVIGAAHERVHGKDVSKPDAIKQIQGTLTKREKSRSIPPNGNSARGNETDDAYADARAIWANSRG